MIQPKSYGWKTLLSFTLVGLWLYIIVRDEMKLFLPAILLVVILSVLFVPIVRIDQTGIGLRSFNPFVNNLRVNFEDVERIHLHAGDIRFRMEFYMNDGTLKKTTALFRYYDMEEVFEHLHTSGVKVTSSGIRTISWKS